MFKYFSPAIAVILNIIINVFLNQELQYYIVPLFIYWYNTFDII